jgi:hypothetical protein
MAQQIHYRVVLALVAVRVAGTASFDSHRAPTLFNPTTATANVARAPIDGTDWSRLTVSIAASSGLCALNIHEWSSLAATTGTAAASAGARDG